MKIILVNGSPHEKGNTFITLTEIAKTFEQENIETEIFNVGKDAISPCLGCGACAKLGRCVIKDKVNDFNEKMKESDGLIVASPVHYAGAVGSLTSFLSRAFFSGFRANADTFRLKPAAAVAVARRAGTSSTLDQLNKFFTISEMPIISGRYWNNVFGQVPDEVMQDFEGIQNLHILAENMAYFLKCKDIAKNAGVYPPEKESDVKFTNFIR